MNIFISLDYELFFGSNSGTQEKSIIYPTNRFLEVLEKYKIKASFFVDSGYIIKLDEYRKKYDVLEDDYQKIISQIKDLVEDGHDIQLHIHPHWEDSYFDGSKWIVDTTRYRIHEFSEDEIDDIVYRYKKVLTDIVGNKVFTFRAGGWCMQPFDKLKNALKKYNIWLDSTVFEGGKNDSITHYFDFTNVPKKDMWKFEDDPLLEDSDGFFTEIPISSYKVSPLFFWKLALAKKLGGYKHKAFGDGGAAGGSKWDKIRMLTRPTNSVVSIDGYKASYLQDAFDKFKRNKENKNFVIIAHPKAMSEYSLEKLEKFIIKNKENKFVTYSNIKLTKYRKEYSRRYSHIGHVSHSNFAYAFGYARAFEILYESKAAVDTIVHPMLFTLRHYLELILKANIEYFAKFSGSSCLISKLADTHEIGKLANGFREHWTLVKKRANIIVDDSSYFHEFDKLIDIFKKLDDKSFSFRFAHDKQGNKSLDGIDQIDIYKIKKIYDEAKVLLNHSVDVFDDNTGIMHGASAEEVLSVMEQS